MSKDFAPRQQRRHPPARIDLNHSAQAVTAVVTEPELEELVLKSSNSWYRDVMAA